MRASAQYIHNKEVGRWTHRHEGLPNATRIIHGERDEMRTTPDEEIKCVHIIPQQGLMQDGDESQNERVRSVMQDKRNECEGMNAEGVRTVMDGVEQGIGECRVAHVSYRVSCTCRS